MPSIARVLDHSGEFEHHGVKRYDDTLLIGDESTIEGIDSPRSHAAVRRLNQIHGHYDIPNDEFQFVLATTIVGPVRWIEAYGWRPLDPKEVAALAKVTTRFGELMGIQGLPSTYDGYLELLHLLRARAVRVRPGQPPGDRGVDPDRPRASHRHRCGRSYGESTIALMDEPLRRALGMPAQPAWFVRTVRSGARLRGRLLRFFPPRRAAYRHRPSTYPLGYALGDLGPVSMLEELNEKELQR